MTAPEQREVKLRPRIAELIGVTLAATVQWACGGPTLGQVPHDQLYQEEAKPALHPSPRQVEPSDWVSAYYNHSFAQLGRLASPGFYLQREVGGPAALDVNDFGKVPDSTWFENRINRRFFSPAAIRRGPNEDEGPAAGSLTVTKAKLKGVTPGFFVRDSQGQRWLVKFDAPAYPELNSGAEVVSTKLLYAAGYNVPQNHVFHFDPARLVLSPKATMADRYNRKVPFSQSELQRLVALLNPNREGKVRALFSRFIEGRPVGPFSLVGTRSDDPNDRIAHERRRSLRGLWVFYAWLNNTDAKVTNGFDTFVEVDPERSLGHLRHYLIDFGTSLGSSGHGVKLPAEGYDYLLDWERIGRRYFGLGLYYPYWVSINRSPYRAVGVFESKVFEPGKWRPLYPNVTFESADRLDTFWAGSILAHMQRWHIDAAVQAAEYSEPGAAQWIADTLWKRRNKLLAHAFDGLSALDDPRVTDGNHLHWTDLRKLAGLGPSAAGYEWSWRWQNEPRCLERRGRVSSTTLPLEPLLSEHKDRPTFTHHAADIASLRLRRATTTDQNGQNPWLTVRIRRLRGNRALPIALSRN